MAVHGVTLASLGIVASARSDMSSEQAQRVAATLDLGSSIDRGDELAVPWHWAYFPISAPTGRLRTDGHPAAPVTGPSLPPNRVFAGGRIQIERPLRVGHGAQRDARLVAVTSKQGRSGEFLLVTVEYRFVQDDQLCITEQQDLVYRHASSPAPARDQLADVNTHTVHRTVIPTRELLFRYSAVTFNTHRIHYDRDYAVHTEGHPDLVVQGPLLATWLAGLAAELLARLPETFDFRATAPTFVDQMVQLAVAEAGEGVVELSALAPSGVVAMSATAT